MRVLAIAIVWANLLLTLYAIYRWNFDAPGGIGLSAVASVALLLTVLTSLHIASTPRWLTWASILLIAVWGLRGPLMFLDSATNGEPPFDESLPIAILTVSAAATSAISLFRRLRSAGGSRQHQSAVP
jgi:hypothetical protein